jgi:hypothetical protein
MLFIFPCQLASFEFPCLCHAQLASCQKLSPFAGLEKKQHAASAGSSYREAL